MVKNWVLANKMARHRGVVSTRAGLNLGLRTVLEDVAHLWKSGNAPRVPSLDFRILGVGCSLEGICQVLVTVLLCIF